MFTQLWAHIAFSGLGTFFGTGNPLSTSFISTPCPRCLWSTLVCWFYALFSLNSTHGLPHWNLPRPSSHNKQLHLHYSQCMLITLLNTLLNFHYLFIDLFPAQDDEFLPAIPSVFICCTLRMCQTVCGCWSKEIRVLINTHIFLTTWQRLFKALCMY